MVFKFAFSNPEIIQYQIMDLTGRVLFESQDHLLGTGAHEFVHDANKLYNGVYLVKFTLMNDNRQIIKKAMISR